MNVARLLLLLQQKQDDPLWETEWTEDHEWLYDEGYVEFKGRSEIAHLSLLGQKVVELSVTFAGTILP